MRSPAAVSTAPARLADAGAITIAGARRALAKAFRTAGLDSPELDARILIGHALGLDHAALATTGARVVNRAECDAINELARRRGRDSGR